MNKQYYEGYDKIIKRRQLAELEKKIKDKEAYYHGGVLLNEKEMKRKASTTIKYIKCNNTMNRIL